MDRRTRYSPEVRERAVRLVFEHVGDYSSQWSAIVSIAEKFGCTTLALEPQTVAAIPSHDVSSWLRKRNGKILPPKCPSSGGHSKKCAIFDCH